MVVFVFGLLIMLGVNALSLSLMGICARWVYDSVVRVLRDYERERFWVVRGGRGGRGAR